MDTVHPKHWYKPTKLHGITWQKYMCSIFLLVRNSNLTKLYWSSSIGGRPEPPQLNIRGPLVIIVEFTSIKNAVFCQTKGLQSERTQNNLGPPTTKNRAPIIFIDVAPNLRVGIQNTCLLSNEQKPVRKNPQVLCAFLVEPPHCGIFGGLIGAYVFKSLPSHKERQWTGKQRQGLTNDFVKNRPHLNYLSRRTIYDVTA